jgi:hypothetical protein
LAQQRETENAPQHPCPRSGGFQTPFKNQRRFLIALAEKKLMVDREWLIEEPGLSFSLKPKLNS